MRIHICENDRGKGVSERRGEMEREFVGSEREQDLLLQKYYVGESSKTSTAHLV
jgi:hypothetical protein